MEDAYRVIKLPTGFTDEYLEVAVLNRQAGEGYDLVQILSDPRPMAIFRRRGDHTTISHP